MKRLLFLFLYLSFSPELLAAHVVCSNTPSAPANAPKFIPAKEPKEVFRVQVNDETDTFIYTGFETGTIEIDKERFTILSVFEAEEYEGFSDLQRFLVKKGDVRVARKHFVGRPAYGGKDRIFNVKPVEAQILKHYQAQSITDSQVLVAGLDLPRCTLQSTSRQWVWHDGTITPPKDLKPVTSVVSNKTLTDAEAKFSPVDPLLYVRSPEGIYWKYQPSKAFMFEFNKEKYECFRHGEKRESRSDQELHRLIPPKEVGALKKIGNHPEFTSLYLNSGAGAKKSEDQLFKYYISDYDSSVEHNEKYARAEENRVPLGPKLNRTAFTSRNPILLVKDELDRAYECHAVSMMPDTSKFVEPLIYVYTQRPQSVQVSVNPETHISEAIPLAIENSWSFSTNQKGQLSFDSGETLPYIFWEGRGANFPSPPEAGVALKADELSYFFEENLPALGLRGREIADFMKYWVKTLSSHEAVLIDMLVANQIDPYTTIESSLKNAQVIRLYLNFRPIRAADRHKYPKKTFPTQTRRENIDTIVEWGGVQWARSQAFY